MVAEPGLGLEALAASEPEVPVALEPEASEPEALVPALSGA